MQEFAEYYEFNNAEYYALIKVTSKYNLMFNAMKIYIKLVGGYDNLDHMRIEKAHPTKIDDDQALFMFLKCKDDVQLLQRDGSLGHDGVVVDKLLVVVRSILSLGLSRS